MISFFYANEIFGDNASFDQALEINEKFYSIGSNFLVGPSASTKDTEMDLAKSEFTPFFYINENNPHYSSIAKRTSLQKVFENLDRLG